MNTRLLLYFFLLTPILISAQSAAYRGGELTVELIDGPNPTLGVTVATYSTLSDPAPETIEICWGDNQCDQLSRQAEQSFTEENRQYSLYTGVHTYTNVIEDFANISVTECCWTPQSRTIPNDNAQAFHLFAGINLSLLGLGEIYHLPVLLQPLFERAISEQDFQYNPNYYDEDGDKITFQLITPPMVEDYLYPNELPLGGNNTLTMDALTGDLLWSRPNLPGLYHLGFTYQKFRNGQLLAFGYRAMEVEVEATISTGEVVLPADWRLSPNPARTRTILTGLPTDFHDLIRVLDAHGRTVQRLRATGERLTLDLSGLPAGLYAVQVGGSPAKRLVIR